MSDNPFSDPQGTEGMNPYGAPAPTGSTREQALAKVRMPATCLMVTGILSIIGSLLYAAFPAVLGGFLESIMADAANNPDLQPQQLDQLENAMDQLNSPLVYVQVVIGTIGGILITLGASKMKKLESYGLSMTACIAAMIPYVSVCCACIFPIAFGIWGIVVLVSQDVKPHFN